MASVQPANYYLKPHVLFGATLGAVFTCEFLVMLLLPGMHDLPPLEQAFLDSLILSVVTVPFLYLFVLRPLQTSISQRREKELESDRIREVDRLKSAFVTMAAHELSTPLAVVRGYAELLLMDRMFDDVERASFATIINEKTYAMERLIDDLLDMNRVQSGRPLRVILEQRNIVATLVSALDDFRMKHPERPVTVTLPEQAVPLSFDSVRVDQLLDHLLSNAERFSPSESPIEVAAAVDNDVFRFSITDHGIGMAPEELRQIFVPFYRADTTDTSAAGLGLGMTLVKENVEAHGGEICVDSRLGAGTTVRVTLPVTA